MNPSTTALTLNMQLPNIAAVAWAVQGDQLSRFVECTLVDGSTAWNPQTGYHGVIRAHKPDGTACVYDVDEDGNPAVTWTGNVATVTIAQQAVTVAGTVLMQLEFYDSNNARITAFAWAMNVQPSAVTDTEFLSTDYYNILTLQIAAVLGSSGHAPYIDPTTKNWMIWDEDVGGYTDSGFSSVGETGPQGPAGPQGVSIVSTSKASGTGAPGTTDVYNVNLSSGSVAGQFSVYNGSDGQGSPGSQLPLMDGTASAGTATAYSREDHVHPQDSEIAELKTDITHFRPNQLKRRWIFIADSYGHASGTNNGWIDKLVTLMGLSVDDYYQSGIGGAGFTTSSNSFESMITTLAASISDKNSITDIVVCGGANDTGVGADTISTAVKSFVSYCETTFPNALVSIGMIAGTTDTTKIGVQYERTLRGYEDCGKARFLNNLQFVFHDYSLIGSDTVHPTATGYTVLADKIYQALMGGCSVNYYETVTPTFDTGYVNAQTGQFTVAVSNDITTISMTNRIGKSTSSSSYYFPVSAGSAIKICNIPSKYIKGVASGTYSAWEFLAQPTTLSVHSTINNTYYEMPGWLTIYNGALYATTVSQVLATTSAFNSCDGIVVLQTSMTAPTMFC